MGTKKKVWEFYFKETVPVEEHSNLAQLDVDKNLASATQEILH